MIVTPHPTAAGAVPLRIGILGAARIATQGMILPARYVPGVEVAALAARDPARAHRLARRHGINTIHTSYAALVSDPAIDAVYNPLPNSLHAEWTLRALQAGKHVLCEKPLAANAAEAHQMAQAARTAGRVLMEAFHYRYHPLIARILAIVRSGELGAVTRIEAAMCVPMRRLRDIRFRYDLAGGATMDLGCYAIHLIRTLASAEPQVVTARATLFNPKIDRAMHAELSFPDGRTAAIHVSLLSKSLLELCATVYGERGSLTVVNPYVPQLFHWLTVRTAAGRRRERVPGAPTYAHQLAAFRDAVCSGGTVLTPAEDAIANMRVVDAIYRASGLPLRGT